MEIATVILAAGRGSRLKDFQGNKTLLPLVPGKSLFEGSHPILLEILTHLPQGPKTLVVHYRKEDVFEATRDLGLTYCEQPTLNGTGGALLAARPFLKNQSCGKVIVTMGDVPLVRNSTYQTLLQSLEDANFVVLGFRPETKRQYGILEIDGDLVRRIVEWKYWKNFSKQRQEKLRICNSGIYAARRDDLLTHLSTLCTRPHKVQKEVDGKALEIEEYFLTDLVEIMNENGLRVRYVTAESENEVMGVDDVTALMKAQQVFRERKLLPSP